MFGLFKQKEKPPAPPREPAPDRVEVEGATFDLVAHMKTSAEGFPRLDWGAVFDWLGTLATEELKDEAWSAIVVGWLLHLRDSVGEGYRFETHGAAIVLSALEPRQSVLAAQFIERTAGRVGHVLEGIAKPQAASRTLIVFDDEETYYRYASQFYPDHGEHAFSSGMHIHDGFSHFITTKKDVSRLEPIVAHELTHACVAHLPLPKWLNEGLAVNTERELTGPGYSRCTPLEMHGRHMKFWNADTIQEFWSGDSYGRPDDGNELSYDLGRLIVEQLAADWPRFAAFANAADWHDGGKAAAMQHLGLDLGAVAAAMLEQENNAGWSPDPQRWKKTGTE